MSDKWQLIKTAPKDGTVISVKNDQMDAPVDARWGDHFSEFSGSVTHQWVIWKDHDRWMPLRRGTLVCPTHWKPIGTDNGDEREQRTR